MWDTKESKYKLLVALALLAVLGSVMLRLGTLDISIPRETQVTTSSRLIELPLALPVSRFKLDQTQKVGLGVYLESAPGSGFEDVVAFEYLVGRKMEYVLLFHGWGDDDDRYPTSYLKYFDALNLTPIYTWEPWDRDFVNPTRVQDEYTLKSIALGHHDNYIRGWAETARNTGIRQIIRFAHEMNTKVGRKSWYPWQGEPEEYIAAYRRIVDIFDQSNADNVEFMWNPILYETAADPDLYYPGDDYVDIVGITVINIGDVDGLQGDTFEWQNCSDRFPEQYNDIVKYNKPVIVAEMLSSEIGGDKAEWITECLNLIRISPLVVGVNSYQDTRDNRQTYQYIDWRIESSSDSLKAFRDGVKKGGYR